MCISQNNLAYALDTLLYIAGPMLTSNGFMSRVRALLSRSLALVQNIMPNRYRVTGDHDRQASFSLRCSE
jgi:hypothetical protein